MADSQELLMDRLKVTLPSAYNSANLNSSSRSLTPNLSARYFEAKDRQEKPEPPIFVLKRKVHHSKRYTRTGSEVTQALLQLDESLTPISYDEVKITVHRTLKDRRASISNSSALKGSRQSHSPVHYGPDKPIPYSRSPSLKHRSENKFPVRVQGFPNFGCMSPICPNIIALNTSPILTYKRLSKVSPPFPRESLLNSIPKLDPLFARLCKKEKYKI